MSQFEAIEKADPPSTLLHVFRAVDGWPALGPDICDQLSEAARLPGKAPGAYGGRRQRHQRFTVAYESAPGDDLGVALATAVLPAITQANERFWQFDIDGIESVQVLRYNQGGGIGLHVDRVPGFSWRKLSAVALLSHRDAYGGGNLTFLRDDTPLEVDLQRGDICVFPSWTLHKVSTVTTGQRVSLAAWAIGPPLR